MTKHNTAIEWTHLPGFKGETWNPIVGCSVVSPGCTNCYAMRMAARLEKMGVAQYGGLTEPSKAGPVWNGTISAAPQTAVLKPLHWTKPRAVFVNSMGDLFHEDVPEGWIDQVFAIMALCPQHIFMVLTKRADRMRDYLCTPGRKRIIAEAGFTVADMMACEASTHKARPSMEHYKACFYGGRVFPNVWLGVSVEDQTRADQRIPDLLATPAAKRFVSCEPLLGPVDLTRVNYNSYLARVTGFDCDLHDPQLWYDTLTGHMSGPDDVGLAKLDWVIAGGESGPNARPMHPDWARALRDQCQGAGVPFFFKQWGEWAPDLTNEGVPGAILLQQDGRMYDRTPAIALAGETHWPMVKVGKAAAGCELDGQTHQAWPEVMS